MSSAQPEAPRQPDESMTLITALLTRPLDPAYAAAAEKRRGQGLPPATSLRSKVVTITALGLGLLLGISAVTLGPRQRVESPVKRELVAQIEQRQRIADERTAQVQSLQHEVARLEQSASRVPGTRLDPDELDELRRSTGMVAVRGPGLVVQLEDARGSESADGDPRTTNVDEGRVTSRDLQVVTNALWAAGAEGMAVNGQRLTSRTAIRFAGDAILVNFRPLVPPYRIETIGDPKSMEVAFGAGPGGEYLKNLSNNFGIRTSAETATEVTLPAAAQVRNRAARVLPADAAVPAPVRMKVKEKTS